MLLNAWATAGGASELRLMAKPRSTAIATSNNQPSCSQRPSSVLLWTCFTTCSICGSLMRTPCLRGRTFRRRSSLDGDSTAEPSITECSSDSATECKPKIRRNTHNCRAAHEGFFPLRLRGFAARFGTASTRRNPSVNCSMARSGSSARTSGTSAPELREAFFSTFVAVPFQ